MRELNIAEISHVSGGGGVTVGTAQSGDNKLEIKATNDVSKFDPGKQYGIEIKGTFANLDSFMAAVPQLMEQAMNNMINEMGAVINAVASALEAIADAIGDFLEGLFGSDGGGEVTNNVG